MKMREAGDKGEGTRPWTMDDEEDEGEKEGQDEVDGARKPLKEPLLKRFRRLVRRLCLPGKIKTQREGKGEDEDEEDEETPREEEEDEDGESEVEEEQEEEKEENNPEEIKGETNLPSAPPNRPKWLHDLKALVRNFKREDKLLLQNAGMKVQQRQEEEEEKKEEAEEEEVVVVNTVVEDVEAEATTEEEEDTMEDRIRRLLVNPYHPILFFCLLFFLLLVGVYLKSFHVLHDCRQLPSWSQIQQEMIVAAVLVVTATWCLGAFPTPNLSTFSEARLMVLLSLTNACLALLTRWVVAESSPSSYCCYCYLLSVLGPLALMVLLCNVLVRKVR